MVEEVSNLNSCDYSLLPAGVALDPMTVCISAYDIIFEFALDALPLFLLTLFYYLYCVHVYGYTYHLLGVVYLKCLLLMFFVWCCTNNVRYKLYYLTNQTQMRMFFK